MNRVRFLLLFYLLQFWGQSQSTLLHCKMVICSDLALPVAHYNQHRKLQDAAFSTEGPPVKEGACLHAVETVNSRLADTCSIVGSLVIFGYMWCAFWHFLTHYLFVCLSFSFASQCSRVFRQGWWVKHPRSVATVRRLQRWLVRDVEIQSWGDTH